MQLLVSEENFMIMLSFVLIAVCTAAIVIPALLQGQKEAHRLADLEVAEPETTIRRAS
jgi:hypothetical protein